MQLLTATQIAYLNQLYARGFGEVTHADLEFDGTTVTLPSVPAVGRRLDVFLNGVLQCEPANYTVVGNKIVFTEALANAVVVVKYITLGV